MATDLTTSGTLKDKTLRERARLLYYGNILPEVIAHTFKVDLDDLNKLILGADGTGRDLHCWYRQKKQLTPTSIVAFISQKVKMLENTSGLAYELLTVNLKRLIDRQQTDEEFLFTVKEMESISKIFIEMDKVTRLEKGEATEIKKNIGMHPSEMMKVLQMDKFNVSLDDPLEAEFEVHN